MTKKLTTEQFIQKARAKHGDTYGYDNVTYVNIQTKVNITCKICQKDFLQIPKDHNKGHGCPTCAKYMQIHMSQGRIIGERLTTEQFIQKARVEHGDTYGYDNVEYINNRTKVNITCLECQEDFLQRPSEHLKGSGCPTCAINKNAKNGRMLKAEFIQKARAKHRDTYRYDNVEYINSRTKVNITCLECQEDFLQRPYCHLYGTGCPKCVNKTENITCDALQSVLDTLKVKHMGYNVIEDIGRMDIVVLNQNADIVCFIEVDGRQHFEFIEFFTRSVEDIQNSDLEKHKRAKMKGYRTIRIDQIWILNSYKKGDNSWVECLKKTILKLEQKIEPDIKDMFLSNKVDKYYSHPCYQYEKDIENLSKEVEELNL